MLCPAVNAVCRVYVGHTCQVQWTGSVCTMTYIVYYDLHCVLWPTLCTMTYIVYYDLYCAMLCPAVNAVCRVYVGHTCQVQWTRTVCVQRWPTVLRSTWQGHLHFTSHSPSFYRSRPSVCWSWPWVCWSWPWLYVIVATLMELHNLSWSLCLLDLSWPSLYLFFYFASAIIMVIKLVILHSICRAE